MTNRNSDKPATLQELIDLVQTQMLTEGADSDKFREMNDELERLYAMKKANKSSRVSPDALVAVAGNLLGIGLILQHERLHVVTSKALSFVTKTKV